MNAYRTYMNRAALSACAHARLMDALERGGRLRHRRFPAAQWVRAVACLVLVCLAGWGLWRSVTPSVGGDRSGQLAHDAPPGTKDVYGPGETPPVVAASGEEYVLLPQDPFHGQPHSMFDIDVVRYGEALGEPTVDRVMPEGTLEERLTRDQMVYLLGGPDAEDAPWTYGWQGCSVSGTGYYTEEGELYQVTLWGIDPENGSNGFRLTLGPGEQTATLADGEYETTDLWGRVVKSSHYQTEYHRTEGWENYCVTFTVEGVGVTFIASSWDADRAANLANFFAHFAQEFHLDRLAPGEAPG